MKMNEREWRAQVTALFEAIEQRLDEFDRRLAALEAQADLWAAIKESILTAE